MTTDPAATDWPTPDQKRVVQFAQAYIGEFNKARDRLQHAGPRVAEYAHELASAFVAAASDGVAVFYINREAKEKAPFDMPEGAWLDDRSEHRLGYVVQQGSGNTIRVWDAKPGTSVFEAREVPDDLPVGLPIGGVNPLVLEPYLHNPSGIFLTAIVVGPLWKVENGLLVSPEPSRIRVFSPVIEGPPYNCCLLQLIYPFADLFWFPERLDLTAEAAKACVEADIEVLLLGIAAGISDKDLAQDPFEAVARHCEEACDAFFKLIESPNAREPEVQRFLEQPAHSFLVSPHNRGVFPRKPLGGNRFVPDFTVARPDDDYHLVEIESPNAPIYQAKGEEPTSEFNHAVQQVEDWLRYIDENVRTVRDEDKMPTIYHPTGEVVIGRDRHLGDKAKTRFKFKRAGSSRIEFKTYDMVVNAGRAYASSIRALKGHLPSQ